jgi:PhoPQ-activated pathogenicity-related protein
VGGEAVLRPDFPECNVFDEDTLMETLSIPHQVTGVIPSSINLQDRAVVIGKGRTYMQKNKKLTIIGNQRQGALRLVVHVAGVQNNAVN